MYRVEPLYARVRRACHVEGMSTREASRVFGVDRKTVRKMLSFSVPPGSAASRHGEREAGSVHGEAWKRRRKQRAAKRIFDRLRDEAEGLCPGPASRDRVSDFGEAMAVIGGVARKVHFLAFDLPHSDGCFVAAYPAVRWSQKIGQGAKVYSTE